jgi:hypothetical protein
MKSFSLVNMIVCATAALLMAGCAAKRVTSSTIQQDSVNIEVRERVEYVTDTVVVEIPYISERVTTRDTLSRLENAYAISEAIVEGDYLTHTLATKPQLREVQIKTPRLRRDSIIYRYANREVEVTVEKQLTFAQKIQLNGFWLMMLAVIILSFVLWMRGRA